MKTLLGLGMLAAALTVHAQGSFEAMSNYVGSTSGNFSAINADINGTIGWTFQPLTSISVTALGAFTYNLPSGSTDIGLWSSDGTLLASGIINSSGTLVDQSRYASITPVTLTSGETYYLGEFSASGPIESVTVYPSESDGPDGYATVSSEIQLDGAAWQTNGVFEFPSTVADAPGVAIVAPNFEFQTVPEPGIITLGSAGILALLAIRRRYPRA